MLDYGHFSEHVGCSQPPVSSLMSAIVSTSCMQLFSPCVLSLHHCLILTTRIVSLCLCRPAGAAGAGLPELCLHPDRADCLCICLLVHGAEHAGPLPQVGFASNQILTCGCCMLLTSRWGRLHFRAFVFKACVGTSSGLMVACLKQHATRL